jgi:exopolysaccharide biosynthesis WecB/TagA/CpsF family protein
VKTQQTGWAVLPHVEIGQHPVAIASRAELADAMVNDCKMGAARPRLVFDVNGHGLSMWHTDASYRRAVQTADVVHADGGFIVTLSRWLTPSKIAERSATTDLIHDFAARASSNGLTFYLLGGTSNVNARCVAQLRKDYPKLDIVGSRDGYFTPEEEPGVVEEINKLRPDVLWVGLGKPKEQVFASKNIHNLRAGWLVTCGGCFNYVTGDYKRAPMWMQSSNLEWLHRLVTNPRQLFTRYLITNPHALWLALFKTSRRTRRASY